MIACRSPRPPAKLAGGACGLLLLASGCGVGEPEQPPQPAPPEFPATSPEPAPDFPGAVRVLATGLEIPWDLDFLPDGGALVTERATGRILQVGPARDGDELAVRPVQTIEEVSAAGEGGLLGIAVSPDYESDGWVYIYYTTDQDNRIARLTLGGPPEPILTGIPHARIHNGGRLAFGPDGYLYASTGDASDPDLAQDPTDPAGAVLRLTPEGDPAPGNPFDSHVWAYGLRNVQGLAWDSAERLWATEFGADSWDEINLLEPGENYGWPQVEGFGDDDRFIDPVMVWRPSEASCAGAAVAGGTLFTACLRGQRLWALDLTESGAVLGAPEPFLVEEFGRLRAIVVAPDGSLWVTTSNRDGRLISGPAPEDDRIIQLMLADADGAGQS